MSKEKTTREMACLVTRTPQETGFGEGETNGKHFFVDRGEYQRFADVCREAVNFIYECVYLAKLRGVTAGPGVLCIY